jgi:hypothetical protein
MLNGRWNSSVSTVTTSQAETPGNRKSILARDGDFSHHHSVQTGPEAFYLIDIGGFCHGDKAAIA